MLVLLLSLPLVPVAGAETLQELKKQLQDATDLIQALKVKIEAMERKEAGKAPSAGPAAGQAPPKSTRGKGTFTIYGFAQADLIQDFNRVNPDWESTLRPSRIPTTEGLYGKDGKSVFSVKQTRLGVKSSYPTKYGEFATKVEFDFYGVGDDAGKTAVRPRHFYGQLGPVLAGQTHSLFMDVNVFPNIIDYWGPPGMPFLRHPQLRWTPVSGEFTFAVAVEEAGNDVSWGVGSDPGRGGSLQARNDLPDFTARVNYKGDWGYVQAGGILRKVGFETVGDPSGDISGDALGWGINLSTNLNFFKQDRLILSTVFGHAIANYMNDGGNDLVVVNGDAETLPLWGVVAYYDHFWNEKWSSSIGYSFTRIDNHNAQPEDAFKLGQYASANLLCYPWKNTMFGVEYLYGRREDKDGDSGNDHRVQFSFKYAFGKSFDFGME